MLVKVGIDRLKYHDLGSDFGQAIHKAADAADRRSIPGLTGDDDHAAFAGHGCLQGIRRHSALLIGIRPSERDYEFVGGLIHWRVYDDGRDTRLLGAGQAGDIGLRIQRPQDDSVNTPRDAGVHLLGPSLDVEVLAQADHFDAKLFCAGVYRLVCRGDIGMGVGGGDVADGLGIGPTGRCDDGGSAKQNSEFIGHGFLLLWLWSLGGRCRRGVSAGADGAVQHDKQDQDRPHHDLLDIGRDRLELHRCGERSDGQNAAKGAKS